ncbi:hypothetical protein CIK75_02755 [Glutamicibacter sp. BW78]|nr:hypothetical protein CIK75_02755 [Glutamicibacter sp. BW78]
MGRILIERTLQGFMHGRKYCLVFFNRQPLQDIQDFELFVDDRITSSPGVMFVLGVIHDGPPRLRGSDYDAERCLMN